MKRFSARSCAGFVLAFSFSVLAESFSYEVYALEGSGKRLLSKGQKTYSRTDVRVTTETAFFTVMVRKELDLGNGFSVGFSDDGKAAVEGIGLWMHRVPGTNEADKFPGFSWEWYNRASGGTFRKLQGAGTIQIQTQKIGKWEFVTRIEFLDQTIFRLSAERGANPDQIRVVNDPHDFDVDCALPNNPQQFIGGGKHGTVCKAIQLWRCRG